VALRCRRRDRSPGEASRLRDELRRLASRAANGNGSLPLVVSGSDAARLRAQIGAAGPAEAEAAAAFAQGGVEAGWLAALLA
jgi:hypothetical protein